jgi:amidase
VTAKLLAGGTIGDRELEEALKMGARWSAELLDLLDRVHVLALPTIPCPPPLLSDPWARLVWLTAPINLAGLPALAMPVPARVAGELPASLQLVGRRRAERWLLTLGARVEAAVGRRADF